LAPEGSVPAPSEQDITDALANLEADDAQRPRPSYGLRDRRTPSSQAPAVGVPIVPVLHLGPVTADRGPRSLQSDNLWRSTSED